MLIRLDMHDDGGQVEFLSFFFIWRYSHCFSFLEQKDKNVSVNITCALSQRFCPLQKKPSNSNIFKHLDKQHACTKLVAKVK